MPSQFIFEVPQVGASVVGRKELFPVRRIYCVGRNYQAHIKEMGGDAKAPPFFFQKPADALVPDGSKVPYPSATSDFQFEVELVLAIGRSGADIPASKAHGFIFGLGVGIDLTRRDLQLKARDTGRPWEAGKSFDHSAPLSALLPLNGAPLPTSGEIELRVNGASRQKGDLSEMIWDCNDIIASLSRLFTLEPGDLIFTGTPAGVGPVSRGDAITASVEGVGSLTVAIV